jgi:Immunity protein 26
MRMSLSAFTKNIKGGAMNLMQLRKSRKPPLVGDFFAFQFKQWPTRFYFGRVVSITAKVGGFDNTTLIYLYKKTSKLKNNIPDLSVDDLLLPPIATNAQAWLKGYFETIINAPMEKGDLLPIHVFKREVQKRFYDDRGNELRGKYKFYGSYSLAGYHAIDEELSQALGLPESKVEGQ